MTAPPVPLGRLLATPRTGEHPVARSPGREKARSFAELERTAASLVARIRSAPAGRWIVHTQGSFEMAAALLSVWQVGSSALLAPNAQPQTLTSLAGEALGVISDETSLADGIDPVLVGDEALDGAVDWREIPPSHCAVELLTSGTTSARKLIPKTLSQLDSEIATQEQCFGERLGPAEIVSTVSHQHLYGLLFQLLWPLSAGRVFHDGPCLLPTEVCSRVAATPNGAALVSAPVHLGRLATHDGVARLATRAREIFSSGGPLDEATADALESALGDAPVEVYGSTETGGIAWRRQSRAAGSQRFAWTPLPGVELQRNEKDEILRVRSPFALASPQAEGWVDTSDRVEMLDAGRFVLRGRADRLVKVGEKSISLPDLEADLCGHAAVDEAACLLVDRKPAPRVGAVVVLSADGRALLESEGRPGVGAELARHLGRSWDRVALPRVWRYVSDLPRDPLGKISVASLDTLIEEPASAESPTSPELLGEESGPDHHERTIRIPEDLEHFRGHFPGHPVVPGVAQIGWVLEIVRGPFGVATPPARVDALKFNHVVRPGDRVHIRVDRKDGGAKFAFRIYSDTQAFSSGRIVMPREA